MSVWFRPDARVLVAGLVLAAGLACAAASGRANDDGVLMPPPELDPRPSGTGPQTAVLAGGCFWGVQGVFQHVRGVSHVVSGYAGGQLRNPSYEDVSSETTGHAETVQITYDPAVVSYGTLLRVFFSVAHDPTQLNRQGPDVGTSYRSNIFYADAAQQSVATAYIRQIDAAGVLPRRIVTRVDPLAAFYPAEDYHQDFLILHPTYPYIAINDLPKIENFKRLLPQLYRETPVRTHLAR